ncbi:MAG TPA: hypothetical protein VII53_01425 [Solirubrobacteraceae bacterium]
MSSTPASATTSARPATGIQIQGLTKSFHSPQGVVRAVRGIDVWTIILARLAAYAYRRDTGRV